MMTQIAGNSMAFVILLPFVFLSWGEIYALFSAITGDIFGPKNASANYGILYTAKGMASILAGYGAALLAAYFAGSFTSLTTLLRYSTSSRRSWPSLRCGLW